MSTPPQRPPSSSDGPSEDDTLRITDKGRDRLAAERVAAQRGSEGPEVKDWMQSGGEFEGHPSGKVPTAIHWNEELDAFEFAFYDTSFSPDMERWERWMNTKGGKFEVVMGPPVHKNETEHLWFRVTGKPAREMYESARNTESIGNIPVPPGEVEPPPIPEGVKRFVQGTVFAWRDGCYDFTTITGDAYSMEMLAEANKSLAELDSKMEILPEALWLRSRHITYRISGPVAQVCYMTAMESGDPSDAAGFVQQTLMGVKRSPINEEDLSKPIPDWEGTRAWRNVKQSIVEVNNDYVEHIGPSHQRVTGVMGVTTDLDIGMVHAHPIVIGVDQVNALPDLSIREACEYLRSADLPFNPVFFDCADGPGAAEMVLLPDQRGNMIGFCGGLVRRAPSPDGEQTLVTPCGAWMQPGNLREFIAEAAETEGVSGLKKEELQTWLQGNPRIASIYGDLPIEEIENNIKDNKGGMLIADPKGHGLPSHAPLGAVAIGSAFYDHFDQPIIRTGTNAEPMLWERLIDFERSPVEMLIVPGHLLDAGKEVAFVIGTPHLHCYQGSSRDAADIIGWAKMIAAQTSKLAASLMLVNAANVELTEAPVSRQVRRQLERKGGQISKTVTVKHRRAKPREEITKSNGSREFSHQFEVIGHFKHMTKGSHVVCPNCRESETPGYFEGPQMPSGKNEQIPCEKCHGSGLNPEKVATCTRRYSDGPQKGELTCPNGCRQEWVPPHVKGPADKPLVLKTRRML